MNTNCISRGGKLASGEALISNNGLNKLSMQTDGNLVLTYNGQVTWATNSSGAGNYLAFAEDGTIAVYNTSGVVVAMLASSNGGVFFIAQDDGNLVEYTQGTFVFATGTNV
ncbi:MAG: hypothetical protein QE487_03750 [Fluviicola sp.]|nr:hypothetical protein [Fluviicola sp.]